VLGLLFGWLFGLFNWIDPVVASSSLAFYGLVFGAVVGALLGLLTHAMTGGRPGLRLGQRHAGQPLRRLGG
jgi:hypothetical protein